MCASFCVIHVHKQKGRRRCIYNSVGDLFQLCRRPLLLCGRRVFGLVVFLCQFRIACARVVYRLQSLRQHLLCHGYVVEGYRAVDKVSLAHLLVYEPVHQVGYALLGVFRQRSRCRLHRVAIISMACSRVNGSGPGYVKSESSRGSSGCSFLYDM